MNPADALRRSAEDPEAFTSFYEEYFKPILGHLARRVCDPDLAFDLAAETFARAFIGRSRFRGSTPEEAEAWVFRIARRQLALYFRRGNVEKWALERLRMQVPRVDPTQRAGIEQLADLAGIRHALRVELSRVPRSQRSALWLRVVEELPYVEVAERLEISEQAARARVSRGLRSLARALESRPSIEEVRA